MLDLLDYRRRVEALYAAVRAEAATDAVRAHTLWRETRDRIFGTHPQSALTSGQKADFTALRYYPYNPALRLEVAIEVEEPELTAGQSAPHVALKRIGRLSLPFGQLALYWHESYSGGIFLPFADATSGQTTYAGGRYLLDSCKGADLGSTPDGKLLLDFNFAYNPSCAYDPMWPCPLAPPSNRLTVAIEAGEMVYP